MTDDAKTETPAAALLQQGLFHHRQGQLDLAMQRYVDVLQGDPTNADALPTEHSSSCAHSTILIWQAEWVMFASALRQTFDR